jgi:UDP-glucose 4-epimerase
MTQTVLVTGGAGYIGSHTVLELLQSGAKVVVIDNLDNSSRESLRRVQAITGETCTFVAGDCCDQEILRTAFRAHAIDAVIHFAGLKAVGESVRMPLRYYRNNLDSTLSLLEVMEVYGCRKFVFSSSATVYGDPERVPIDESCRLQATNPYGRTKLFIEEILRDHCAAREDWHCALLRYFNPIGAHESGRIGEDPQGIPNNLMPYIMQVAVGRRDRLTIHGDDYDTPDGTGVRDYIHVVDLAKGHLAALEHIAEIDGCETFNLGTGRGYSVREVLQAASNAVGRELPATVGPRRPGDIAACYADPTKARERLGWEADLGIDRMCADSWRWQSQNPNGYDR